MNSTYSNTRIVDKIYEENKDKEVKYIFFFTGDHV
jgi:hypothetical protein